MQIGIGKGVATKDEVISFAEYVLRLFPDLLQVIIRHDLEEGRRNQDWSSRLGANGARDNRWISYDVCDDLCARVTIKLVARWAEEPVE